MGRMVSITAWASIEKTRIFLMQDEFLPEKHCHLPLSIAAPLSALLALRTSAPSPLLPSSMNDQLVGGGGGYKAVRVR